MNRYPRGRWTTAPLHDVADQSAVLSVKPLSGLEAHHEAGGRYVLLLPRADKPTVFDCIAENLTQAHAQAICAADRSRKILSEFPLNDANKTTFTNQVEGGTWYDIPFAYLPGWPKHRDIREKAKVPDPATA